MQKSDILNLTPALIKAKSEFETILKKGVGKVKGQTKSGTWYEYEYAYALFEDVLHATDKHLENNKLMITESTESTDKGLFVKVSLTHETGESISCNVPVLVGETKKNDMQALGAALSYARRYGRCLLLGIVAEQDDDGSRSRDDDRKKAKAEKVEKDLNDKSRTASTKKEFFKKYYENIEKCKDADALYVLQTDTEEDYKAVLSTYKEDVREQIEQETQKNLIVKKIALEMA